MSIDVEDRRRAEEALRAREGRFRLIVDAFRPVTLRTPTGDLEFANRRYLEYFGATLEQLKAVGVATTSADDALVSSR